MEEIQRNTLQEKLVYSSFMKIVLSPLIFMTCLFCLTSQGALRPCRSEKKILKKYSLFEVTEYDEGERDNTTTIVKLLPKEQLKNFYSVNSPIDDSNEEFDSDYDWHFVSGIWANLNYVDEEEDDEKYPGMSCVAVTHDSGHSGDDFEEHYSIKAVSKSSFITYYSKSDLKDKTYSQYTAIKPHAK